VINTQPGNINIYPNPFHDNVNVNVSGIAKTEVVLTLTDILGNNIYYHKQFSEYGFNKKIDMHNMPAGIYLVKLEYNGEIKTTRIIKN
jgi:hypothetical protein